MSRGLRCVPSSSSPSHRLAAAVVALLALSASPLAAVELAGSWQNQTFGSSGATTGSLVFDGLGNASFTFRPSHLCGVPGSFPLTLTGPVDPDDFSFSAAVNNHPIYGNVAVQVDANGNVSGTATNGPGLFGGSSTFTGKLRLAGNDVGLDLDTTFSCGPSGSIRTTHDLGVAAPCVENPTTLCLRNNRFKVTMSFRPRRQSTQDAKVAVQGTNDSGLFYFTDSQNWEMLAKIVNGCGLNNRYWVFLAATTNVEYTVTVTDTLRNKTKQYKNALGTAALPVQDTNAFATCP